MLHGKDVNFYHHDNVFWLISFTYKKSNYDIGGEPTSRHWFKLGTNYLQKNFHSAVKFHMKSIISINFAPVNSNFFEGKCILLQKNITYSNLCFSSEPVLA